MLKTMTPPVIIWTNRVRRKLEIGDRCEPDIDKDNGNGFAHEDLLSAQSSTADENRRAKLCTISCSCIAELLDELVSLSLRLQSLQAAQARVGLFDSLAKMVRKGEDSDAKDPSRESKNGDGEGDCMAQQFTERQFTQYRKAACNPVAFSSAETSRSKIRNSVLRKKEMVYLNVYHLTDLNCCLKTCGLAIYHSSIEVYGIEYAFGGHPGTFTGVFETQPFYVLVENKLLPPAVKLKTQHMVGFTSLPHSHVQQLVDDFSHEWPGNEYDLLRRNCNHYSRELASRFNERFIYPPYINRIAGVADSIACCLPRSIAVTTFPVDPPFGPKGRQLGTWADLSRTEVQRMGLSQNLMAATSEDPPAEHNIRQYAAAAALERFNKQQARGRAAPGGQWRGVDEGKGVGVVHRAHKNGRRRNEGGSGRTLPPQLSMSAAPGTPSSSSLPRMHRTGFHNADGTASATKASHPRNGAKGPMADMYEDRKKLLSAIDIEMSLMDPAHRASPESTPPPQRSTGAGERGSNQGSQPIMPMQSSAADMSLSPAGAIQAKEGTSSDDEAPFDDSESTSPPSTRALLPLPMPGPGRDSSSYL